MNEHFCSTLLLCGHPVMFVNKHDRIAIRKISKCIHLYQQSKETTDCVTICLIVYIKNKLKSNKV